MTVCNGDASILRDGSTEKFDLIMCVKLAKYRLMKVCHTCCTRLKHSKVITSSYCVGALGDVAKLLPQHN